MNKGDKIDLLNKLTVSIPAGASVAVLDGLIDDTRKGLENTLNDGLALADSCDAEERGPWRDAMIEVARKMITLGAIELAKKAFEAALKFIAEKTDELNAIEDELKGLGAFDPEEAEEENDDENAEEAEEEMTGTVRSFDPNSLADIREAGLQYAELLGRFAVAQRKAGRSAARFVKARRKIIKIVQRNLR